MQFDVAAKEAILSGDQGRLIHYEQLGRPALLSIPTNEHSLPLLYALGAGDTGEHIRFYNERVVLGCIAMRSLAIGR